MTRLGLTLEQLAELRDLPVDDMRALLEDTASLGLCEQGADGRWRLTDAAEREYGKALLEVQP